MLFCFIFLFLAGNGSGGFSLDSLLHRRKDRAGEGRRALFPTGIPEKLPEPSLVAHAKLTR